MKQILFKTERNLSYILGVISSLPIGKCITITDRSRTLEQNAKFHAMIGDILKVQGKEYAGYILGIEDWKALMAASYLKAEGADVKAVPTLENDGFVMLGVKTSGFSIPQAAGFIEYLYAYGQAMSVVWGVASRKAYREIIGKDMPC